MSRRRDRRWGGPFRGDDRLEFRAEQVLIRADQVEELVIDRWFDAGVGDGVAGHDRSLPGQALMACRSSPVLVMEILRGLACSATGICRVSTPAS